MVARVIREAVRYAKNNAAKRVAAKNSRKAANEAKKRGTTRRTEKIASTRLKNRESINTKINKAPPAKRKELFKKLTGTKAYKKSEKDFKNLVKNAKPLPKTAKKSLLRKYGVPAAIIAGVLGGSTLLNKKRS